MEDRSRFCIFGGPPKQTRPFPLEGVNISGKEPMDPLLPPFSCWIGPNQSRNSCSPNEFAVPGFLPFRQQIDRLSQEFQ